MCGLTVPKRAAKTPMESIDRTKSLMETHRITADGVGVEGGMAFGEELVRLCRF